ncbi:hypothetical protein KIPB_005396 [Kipferlia bialata]|uniref:Uncharacterized protein n=1 Tax=Kipferlia bialata TaxID=797122 RepID=A0A9K3CVI9_9EUKA|nr:hypothetical protein KIPB_005396 [Kipferlia bialata]|eukprot:g5396.t1
MLRKVSFSLWNILVANGNNTAPVLAEGRLRFFCVELFAVSTMDISHNNTGGIPLAHHEEAGLALSPLLNRSAPLQLPSAPADVVLLVRFMSRTAHYLLTVGTYRLALDLLNAAGGLLHKVPAADRSIDIQRLCLTRHIWSAEATWRLQSALWKGTVAGRDEDPTSLLGPCLDSLKAAMKLLSTLPDETEYMCTVLVRLAQLGVDAAKRGCGGRDVLDTGAELSRPHVTPADFAVKCVSLALRKEDSLEPPSLAAAYLCLSDAYALVGESEKALQCAEFGAGKDPSLRASIRVVQALVGVDRLKDAAERAHALAAAPETDASHASRAIDVVLAGLEEAGPTKGGSVFPLCVAAYEALETSHPLCDVPFRLLPRLITVAIALNCPDGLRLMMRLAQRYCQGRASIPIESVPPLFTLCYSEARRRLLQKEAAAAVDWVECAVAWGTYFSRPDCPPAKEGAYVMKAPYNLTMFPMPLPLHAIALPVPFDTPAAQALRLKSNALLAGSASDSNALLSALSAVEAAKKESVDARDRYVALLRKQSAGESNASASGHGTSADTMSDTLMLDTGSGGTDYAEDLMQIDPVPATSHFAAFELHSLLNDVAKGKEALDALMHSVGFEPTFLAVASQTAFSNGSHQLTTYALEQLARAHGADPMGEDEDPADGADWTYEDIAAGSESLSLLRAMLVVLNKAPQTPDVDVMLVYFQRARNIVVKACDALRAREEETGSESDITPSSVLTLLRPDLLAFFAASAYNSGLCYTADHKRQGGELLLISAEIEAVRCMVLVYSQEAEDDEDEEGSSTEEQDALPTVRLPSAVVGCATAITEVGRECSAARDTEGVEGAAALLCRAIVVVRSLLVPLGGNQTFPGLVLVRPVFPDVRDPSDPFESVNEEVTCTKLLSVLSVCLLGLCELAIMSDKPILASDTDSLPLSSGVLPLLAASPPSSMLMNLCAALPGTAAFRSRPTSCYKLGKVVLRVFERAKQAGVEELASTLPCVIRACRLSVDHSPVCDDLTDMASGVLGVFQYGVDQGMDMAGLALEARWFLAFLWNRGVKAYDTNSVAGGSATRTVGALEVALQFVAFAAEKDRDRLDGSLRPIYTAIKAAFVTSDDASLRSVFGPPAQDTRPM